MGQKQPAKSEVIEQGDIYFIFRPKVEQHDPKGVQDVERFRKPTRITLETGAAIPFERELRLDPLSLPHREQRWIHKQEQRVPARKALLPHSVPGGMTSRGFSPASGRNHRGCLRKGAVPAAPA